MNMEVGQKAKIRNLSSFQVLYGVITNIEENMFDVKTEDEYWKTMTFDKLHMRGIRQYTGWMVEGLMRS